MGIFSWKLSMEINIHLWEFMEINEYLPSHSTLLTAGLLRPHPLPAQIISEPGPYFGNFWKFTGHFSPLCNPKLLHVVIVNVLIVCK